MIKNETIAIFDTSISSLNVGDQIIMDAVLLELGDIFKDAQHIRVPSHEKIGLTSLSVIRRSGSSIVGGSNILSSAMNKYRQWKLSLIDAFFIKNKVTLLGVGWRQYQGATNTYTRLLLKRILNQQGLHSVRDAYTAQKLKDIGVVNVVNTACPTMWRLTPDHCTAIPETKSTTVIFTLTDYDKDVELDGAMIDILKRNYKELYFWVQGSKDFAYFSSFGDKIKNITVVPPNLRAYNAILSKKGIDYVGTRLHAGIRALQYGVRTIIIGIDNRAEEKRKDFGLPVLPRTNMTSLEGMIIAPLKTVITLPFANIEIWKNQFKL